MSAGAFLATIKAAKDVLSLLRKDFLDRGVGMRLENTTNEIIWDDQRALRHLHIKKYPDIKVDTFCRVFARRDDYLDKL